MFGIPTNSFAGVGSWFDVSRPPQSPGCYGGAAGEGIGVALGEVITPATSRHEGVNVALADGRCRGVSASIDAALWGKLGTAAEGDLAGSF